jgi:dimethylglycine dehydrogenase
MDWLTAHLRKGEDVTIRSLTNDQTILVLAGPKARAVLSQVSRGDWSRAAFPWLSVRECFVGFAPATVFNVSFSGEQAFEIHLPNASLYAAYLALRQAGADHDLRLFGSRAVEAMRIEKGFLHWKADLLTEFDPFETGLGRFVSLDKVDFVGKSALVDRHAAGPKRLRVSLVIDSATAPAHPGGSLMQGDRVVGTVTSGAFGHRVKMNLAYAFVEPEFSAVGTELMLDLCGDMIGAKVITPSPYDPEFKLLRA